MPRRTRLPLSLVACLAPLAMGCSSETFRTNANGNGDAGALTEASVCSDTTNDSNHCGACNHSCLGGACTERVCQPVALATSPDLPSTLVLDGSSFYAGLQRGNGGLLECPLAGCATGAGPSLTGFWAGGITVDSDTVYVADIRQGGKVFRSTKGTATKAQFAEGDVTVLLRHTNEGLYIASDGSGLPKPATITRVNPGGDTVTLATTASPIRGIAFTDNRVLWTEPATHLVHSCLKNGTTPVTTPETFLSSANASGTGTLGITVLGDRVFVAGHVQGNIVRCALATVPCSPELVEVGGAPSLLVGDEPAKKLYWYDASTKAIRSCDVSRGCKETKTDLVSGIANVFDLAVGTDAVYFTVRAAANGGVYRVAK